MKIRIFFLLVSLIANCAQAAHVETPATQIVAIYSYNQFGSGDVMFKVADNVADCSDGYWLTKADPGFQANFSILVSA